MIYWRVFEFYPLIFPVQIAWAIHLDRFSYNLCKLTSYDYNSPRIISAVFRSIHSFRKTSKSDSFRPWSSLTTRTNEPDRTKTGSFFLFIYFFEDQCNLIQKQGCVLAPSFLLIGFFSLINASLAVCKFLSGEKKSSINQSKSFNATFTILFLILALSLSLSLC